MNKNKRDVLHIGIMKNFFDFRMNKWIIISSFVLLAAVYFYFSSFQRKIVFPDKNNFNFDFYNDRGNGGNSKILSHSISDTAIDFKFQLKEGFISPYVGIDITGKKDSTYNLAGYNRLYLEIAGDQIRTVGFSLYTRNIYSASKKDIYFYENIDIVPERKLYVVNLDELKVPEWWYITNNIPVNEKIKPDLKNIHRINIGTVSTVVPYVNSSIRVFSISFERDNGPLILFLILGELVLLALLVIIHYIKAYRALPVTITYKAVDTENEEQHIQSFLHYINNNFHDHNLTLAQVSDQTGINQRRITASIQQSFGCNFKTYVNRLRINESKRLLIESELNMGEIAFKVGFSNQTHFNRVFKNLEGINPSEFLENNQM